MYLFFLYFDTNRSELIGELKRRVLSNCCFNADERSRRDGVRELSKPQRHRRFTTTGCILLSLCRRLESRRPGRCGPLPSVVWRHSGAKGQAWEKLNAGISLRPPTGRWRAASCFSAAARGRSRRRAPLARDGRHGHGTLIRPWTRLPAEAAHPPGRVRAPLGWVAAAPQGPPQVICPLIAGRHITVAPFDYPRRGAPRGTRHTSAAAWLEGRVHLPGHRRAPAGTGGHRRAPEIFKESQSLTGRS
jgi:hypothetical protein